MNPTLVSVIAFLCVSGGIVLGLFLHTALPPHHFKDDSRSAVQLGMGVIGTMTAILLGVLIGSGKGFYDSENKELTEVSAKILLLDRALALYGPETHDIRSQLRDAYRHLSMPPGLKNQARLRLQARLRDVTEDCSRKSPHFSRRMKFNGPSKVMPPLLPCSSPRPVF